MKMCVAADCVRFTQDGSVWRVCVECDPQKLHKSYSHPTWNPGPWLMPCRLSVFAVISCLSSRTFVLRLSLTDVPRGNWMAQPVFVA